MSVQQLMMEVVMLSQACYLHVPANRVPSAALEMLGAGSLGNLTAVVVLPESRFLCGKEFKSEL